MPDFEQPLRVLLNGKPVATVHSDIVTTISAGDADHNGVLSLNDKKTIRVVINGGNGNMFFRKPADGGPAGPIVVMLNDDGNLYLGGSGTDGDIVLYPNAVENDKKTETAAVHISAQESLVTLSRDGQPSARIDGKQANIWLDNRIRLEAADGNVFIGGNGRDGDIVIFNKSGDNKTVEDATIHLDGDAGDIILRNADCAEEFDLDAAAAASGVEPGTVVVINDSGELTPSRRAYDSRVAGVVSGAGGLRPAIRLGRQPGGSARTPVALVGTVFCKVDAAEGPIEVGSLLTTSSTPGHAMRAVNRDKAFGTVLGKSLAPHDQGRGLIPILVTLQ